MRRILAVFLSIGLLAVAGAAVGYRAWKYPFGRSPDAAAQLFDALRRYAADHEGRFPSGEQTPEGSLTLLFREGYLPSAEVLRGKCVPLETTVTALERDDELDPFTCGWHYEEGLSTSDAGELALAWDKCGLGPEGGRVFRGAIEVLLVSGETRLVRDYAWVAFAKEQMALQATRDQQRLADAPGGATEPIDEALQATPFD